MDEQLDAQTIAWLDQEDRRTAEIIRRFGVYIQCVGGDIGRRRTTFAYTVGLFGLGHPELLLFGVDGADAGRTLNLLATRVREGADLTPGETLSLPEATSRIVVETVPNPGQIVFAANRFYQRPDEASVPVLQLTYDDESGLFPWSDGYSLPSWLQPRPGEFRADL